MSLVYPHGIESVKVLDPKLNFYNDKKYVVLKGGSQNTYQRYPANNVSSSSIQWTVNPPNNMTAINRHVLIRYYVNINFTGTSVSGNLLQLGTNDGFRAFPISSNLDTATVQINNGSVVQNISDYIQALLRYNDNIFIRSEQLSSTPSMLDQYQNYSDWTTLGSSRNVLAFYGENSIETTRGSFPITVVSNTPTSAQITAVITEPLYLSPFLYTNAQEQALIGVNTMTINFNLNSSLGSNLTTAWSHSTSGNNLTSATLTFYQAPEVLMNFITPDEVMNVPAVVEYPYFDIIRYPNPPQTLSSNATSIFNSSNIQVDGVPEAIYIFARQSNSDKTITSTDTFGYISNLQITFNNNSQIFASATPQDLYFMSQKNGLTGVSWPAWSQYVGSVIKVNPSVDFPMGADMASGVGGSYNLLVQATVQNINQSNSLNMVLYVVIVREGVLTVNAGQTIQSINDLTRSDVLNSPITKDVSYDQALTVASQGGDFRSSIKSALGKLVNAIPALGRKVCDHFYPNRGSGMHGDCKCHEHGGVLIGGEGMHRHKKRKHHRGGGMLSRADLKKNIVDFDNFSESD